jgi:hypothetical protein
MSGVAATYRIEDEPHPGTLSHLAVRPLWPLFAFMFGGAWISWPWFAWNGWIVGSPTRRREIAWLAGGAAGLLALGLAAVVLVSRKVIGDEALPYVRLVFLLWKLGVSYAVFSLQSRTFQIYEHYGGAVKSGLIAVFLAYWSRSWIQSHVSLGLWGLFF